MSLYLLFLIILSCSSLVFFLYWLRRYLHKYMHKYLHNRRAYLLMSCPLLDVKELPKLDTKTIKGWKDPSQTITLLSPD